MMKIMKLLFILSVALVSGCSMLQGPSVMVPDKYDEEKKEIIVWLFPGTGLEPLIDEYSQMHPDIQIDVQQTQFEDVQYNLQNAFALGYGAF